MKNQFVFKIVVICLILSFSINAYADSNASTSNAPVLTSIFSGLGQAANFLKELIIPDENYFHNSLASLSKHLNERLGAVGYLYQTLNNFFKELNNVPSVDMIFKMPQNFFYAGYQGFSVDFLSSARPYIKLMRNALSSSIALLTAIACYHKLRMLFQAGDST